MKLILSRKGFDSSAGGVPSPILPDGRLLSLPIPDGNSAITYGDITCDGTALGTLVPQLTGGRLQARNGAHIDPDLVHDSLPRGPGWRPIFGQMGQAQGHLRNNKVGPGDLFLFFGLFRRVDMRHGAYKWTANARPIHAIWGWLQVEEVLPVEDARARGYTWAEYHPHFCLHAKTNNVVYLAGRRLHVDGAEAPLPGAGVFHHYSPTRQLTARHANRPSLWELPGWFHPGHERPPLTYHADMQRWNRQGERTELRAAARGQEFVLDCQEYPEAAEWARGLIGDAGTGAGVR